MEKLEGRHCEKKPIFYRARDGPPHFSEGAATVSLDTEPKPELEINLI